RRRQAQAPRIPRLHPGRHRLPWTASLPRGRVCPARLELLRVLVAQHSPGRIPPSDLVVATQLRQRLPEFLLHNDQTNIYAKFIAERQYTNMKLDGASAG